MSSLGAKVNKILNKRSVKYAVPFCLVIVGGSFGLREFARLRYEFSNVSELKREDFKKYGIEIKDRSEVTLESEYEKIKKLDIDNWVQVRGPRPWEEKSE